MSATSTPDPRDDLSLVRDDFPFRLQQRVHLIPLTGGLGIGRRALFWALVAWLPIVVWAWIAGRALALQGSAAEPLLQHFGVHARLLIGIPLLIIAEAVAQKTMERLITQFIKEGIVRGEAVAQFKSILASTARLRAMALPWIVIVGLAIGWQVAGLASTDIHEVVWARGGPTDRTLGFGGWWYVYVGRPIFVVLLLGWLWRVILLAITFGRIAKLDLTIVPTHPDRAGGLGFIERFPAAFGLIAFVLAFVLAAGWAHDVEYHQLDVHTLYPMMILVLVLSIVILLAPALVFLPKLLRAKKEALLDYGALVARHGTAVREKWILGMKRDDPLLEAPEIGPVADTIALYESVQRMRPVPLGKSAVLAIAVPVLIPFIGVLALQIPLKQLLGQLVKGLL